MFRSLKGLLSIFGAICGIIYLISFGVAGVLKIIDPVQRASKYSLKRIHKLWGRC